LKGWTRIPLFFSAAITAQLITVFPAPECMAVIISIFIIFPVR
jgi:hypothetical protein